MLVEIEHRCANHVVTVHRGECGVHVYPFVVRRPSATLHPYLVVHPIVDPLPAPVTKVRVRVAVDVSGSLIWH